MIDPELSAARRSLLSQLEGRLDELAEDQLAVLVRRITTLRDRELRRLKLTRLIGGSCDRLGHQILRWLWHCRADDDPLAREMLLELLTTRPLSESLGYDKVRDLYARCHVDGPAEMGRLFLTPPAPRRPGMLHGDVTENEKMVSVSLGLRKAHARGRDRFKLDRLRFDRNPAVIRNLLRNPRVVERDVVHVAAQRPTNPECLAEVYRSPRWIGRYAVKKAIAFNPWAPMDIVMALMPHLLRQDLRDLSRSKVSDEQLRVAARELLKARTCRPAATSGDPEDGGGEES